MEGELELIFHDTVPQPEEILGEARSTAAKQKECILAFFRERFAYSFTPQEVYDAINGAPDTWGMKILLTSVRRSISDLTKEGRLRKCQWSESRMGAYGKLNRVWQYNNGYINRLNPKK